MLKIARLDDAFSEVFLTASKPSRRSITAAKTREKEKKERQKKIPKIEKPKDVGKLLCCKCIFDRIKGYLADIQPKNHQNVQKTHFLEKVPGVSGLNLFVTCLLL